MAIRPISTSKNFALYENEASSSYCSLDYYVNWFFTCFSCCHGPTQFEKEASMRLISMNSESATAQKSTAVVQKCLSSHRQEKISIYSKICSLSQFLSSYPKEGIWVYTTLQNGLCEENIDFVFLLSCFFNLSLFDLLMDKMPEVFVQVGANLTRNMFHLTSHAKYIHIFQENWQLSNKHDIQSLVLKGFSREHNYLLFELFFSENGFHQLNLSFEAAALCKRAKKPLPKDTVSHLKLVYKEVNKLFDSQWGTVIFPALNKR